MRQEHPIRGILKHRGSSLRWLAHEIGLDETLVNHYLAARRRVPADFYDKVARVLQVPASMLRPDAAPASEAAA